MAELVIERERDYYYPYVSMYRIIDTIIALIEGVLAIRLLLIFFGANPASTFVAFIYSLTNGLVAPFVGAFPAWVFGGFVVDTATILAMIAYSIIAWVIARLLAFIFDSARTLP